MIVDLRDLAREGRLGAAREAPREEQRHDVRVAAARRGVQGT